MISAAWALGTRPWFTAPLVLFVFAVLALTSSKEWQALALPQVLTDIETALPPADQVALAREAVRASDDASMPNDRSAPAMRDGEKKVAR